MSKEDEIYFRINLTIDKILCTLDKMEEKITNLQHSMKGSAETINDLYSPTSKDRLVAVEDTIK